MECFPAIDVTPVPGGPPPGGATGHRIAGSRRARGFTLQEAALAIVIVGIAFVATMELFAACTRENQHSAKTTTAQLLAANIQEMTASLPLKDPYYAPTYFGPEAGENEKNYNDLDDFDGETFNPPFDSTREAVTELSQYTQVIHVMNVDPNQTGENTNYAVPTIPKVNYTGAMRLRVIILYKARPNDPPQEVHRASWIRLNN